MEKTTEPAKKTFASRVKSNLLAGILIVVPVVLSFWIGWKLYDMLTAWGLQLGRQINLPVGLSPFWRDQCIRVLSLCCVLALLSFFGMLTKVTIGNKLLKFAQFLLMKMPIINVIYSTCKQIADAMQNSQGGNMFRQVVLFEYPRKGSWTVGFLTNHLPADFEVSQKLNEQVVTVFVPTTPNPTSGFLFVLPQKDVIPLEMTVSEAMKFIVGCGGVLPADKAGELQKNA